MSYRGPRSVLPTLVVASAGLVGVLLYQSWAASSSSATSPFAVEALPPQRGAPGTADGAGPDGVTVFDDEYPAVANLDPGLLDALRRAATDAAVEGVELVIDGGWRSPEYQEKLLHEAVVTYGSEREAARWVATPDTSAHVSGDAVDVGPSAAAVWLSEHGAEYGLCQEDPRMQ